MGRRRKPESRCKTCLCPTIEAFRERWSPLTRISVLMHHREEHLTTNTAHLASLMLPRCQIHIRGDNARPLNVSDILHENESPLLLYPSEDAQTLTRELVEALPHPPALIVPDGSWRQASKVAKREEFLAHVPRVVLTPDAPSRYRLRREPKAQGLATFEAMARALGVLEGPALRVAMEEVFDEMVENTLKSREGILRTTSLS